MTSKPRLAALLFVLAVAIYPLAFHSGYALGAAIVAAGFAIGATGLVLLLGLAHQLAIGQAAFYMIGGYGSAILTTRYGWDGASAMAASAACALLVAFVVGGPILRLRGFVLAIASLALQLLFIALAILLENLTGGSAGIPAVPHFSIGPWPIANPLGFYFVCWILVAAAIGIASNIANSRIGRALRALAADEAGAAASGINTTNYKLLIFVVSAGMASIGGSLIVHFLRVMDPTVFGLQFSLDIVTTVIVGGLQSIWGGVIGAIAIIALREGLRLLGQPAWEVIIMGVLTVIVLLGFRAGIAGAVAALFQRDDHAGHGAPSTGVRALAFGDFARQDGLLLRVRNAARSFGSLRAVGGVSFDVNAGEIVALIGPNGAGKTTMLDMISGHRALDRGGVAFLGRNVGTRMPDAIARAGVARTFQTVRAFDNMSVLANVICGCHAFSRSGLLSICLGLPDVAADEDRLRKRAMDALAFVGLTHAAGQTPSQLPFGHRRMMELARAIAQQPALLLLDEPASGLNDAETEAFAGPRPDDPAR
jgi:branched-chain amino acid transport system permease protein